MSARMQGLLVGVFWGLALLGLLQSMAGCGGAEQGFRTGLAAAAHVVPDTVDIRIAHQDRLDARCHDSSHDFLAWRACMEPAYRVDAAVAVYSSWLLAAEAAVDASGEEGWRDVAPCVIEAARELVAAFTEAGLAIPDQVSKVLALGVSLTGTCGGGQ